MSKTKIPTREELVDRYVRTDALEMTLVHLAGQTGLYELGAAVALALTEGAGDELHHEPLEEIQEGVAGHLLSELWPDDEDIKTAEYVRANARTSIVEAHILSAIADHADDLRVKSRALLASASRELRAAERKADDD